MNVLLVMCLCWSVGEHGGLRQKQTHVAERLTGSRLSLVYIEASKIQEEVKNPQLIRFHVVENVSQHDLSMSVYLIKDNKYFNHHRFQKCACFSS